MADVDFTPRSDFFSEETKSQYAKGLGYTAREDNPSLQALVKKWVSAGKVEYGRPAAQASGAAKATKPKKSGRRKG